MEPIDLQKDHYIQLVCLYTNLQYSKSPTTYPEVIDSALDRDFIKLERELIDHPLTNIHMHFAMLTRVAWAEAVLYGATREHVSDVWLSGNPAVSQGRLLAFDEQELGALRRNWSERLSAPWSASYAPAQARLGDWQ